MQLLFSGWEDESWPAIHHGMKWPEDREADGKKKKKHLRSTEMRFGTERTIFLSLV